MIRDKKKNLGQFFTTNYNYILQNLKPIGTLFIEPFAGEGHLIEYIRNSTENKVKIIAYDIDPKHDWITQKDTLLNPPNYSNKFVITNPPFLAKK